MGEIQTFLLGIVALIGGLAVGYFVLNPKVKESMEEYRKEAESMMAKSGQEGQKAKEDALARVQSFKEMGHRDEERLKEQFTRIEQLIISKETNLGKKQQKAEELKAVLENEKKTINDFEQKMKNAEKEFSVGLAKKAGVSIGEAKAEILNELEQDLSLATEDRLRKYVECLEDGKVRIAKNMVTGAIQRYADPTSVEKRITAIDVPRDDMKARILGVNCQNLLLLEELTGVDIIFNDSPNTVIISCFDLVKKHIARETIMKLIKERDVNIEKIKQRLEEVKAETDRSLLKIGKDVIKKLDLDHRKFPDDFAKIVGRLQFRTSYGQNILRHSFEVGNFTMMLGSELGVNMETGKIAGFFHDLGKAIDQESGLPHDVLTKEIMEKYVFSEEEIHAAWAHHDAIPQRTPEAMLVKAGDAISAGRPGARQESIEKYIERIKAIESIAGSHEGVSKTFAISAGREVRVLVEPGKLKDADLQLLAGNIAREIQENVAYPGRIKVNVIRRTQSIDYAKK